MGMYTQIRGWLNVTSIDFDEEIDRLQAKFYQARYDFMKLHDQWNKGPNKQAEGALQRPWVCQQSSFYIGGNGSAWIFIGVEYKNYDRAFDEWLKFLLERFPSAEGRIEYQYEEHGPETQDRYVLIAGGKIVKDDYQLLWTKGYGNCEKVAT